MAALTVGQESLDLRIRQGDWDRLFSHLFPGDLDEHGAVLLCGFTESARRKVLLVRELVLAQDGKDYIPGERGYRHLTGAFVTQQLRRAKDLGLVYLAVHNHGGSTSVGFSEPDMSSHERAYPTLLAMNGKPVGGLVVATRALAGDIWFSERRFTVRRTTIVGEKLTELTPSPALRAETGLARFDRQALLFGAAGQAKLSQLQVGVVGLGGVGMLVVQALARLGVGHFVLVDPDRVSSSNLPRLPETTRFDAMEALSGSKFATARIVAPRLAASKVRVARRIVRRANESAIVTGLRRDVADDDVARQLTGCDFLFLAADTMLARDVVNQIAYQYLIPTLQIGSKVVVDAKSGDILDVFAVVRSIGTEPGCLFCNGLINPVRLSEETLGDEQQRQNQRYVADDDVHAPSVITLNSMAVGWAVNDFMHYAVGIGRPMTGFRILRSRPVGIRGQQLTVQVPTHDGSCHVCGIATHSALSRGDYTDLPTRVRPQPAKRKSPPRRYLERLLRH